MHTFKLSALCCVSAAALLAATAGDAAAQTSSVGQYQSGDFHNHTTCSDGSTSVQTLTDAALNYLDWFIQAGHSGQGNRDCRFDDPDSGLSTTRVFWSDDPSVQIKGLAANGQPQSTTGNMWRWQALQEFTYPIVTDRSLVKGQLAFVGLEWVVPGHEHTSMSVITDQYPVVGGNVDGLAQFEYCFAANSEDTSGGAGQGWTCEIGNTSNSRLINRFSNDPVNQGPPNYNASLNPVTLINTSDTGDHVKSTAGIYWMQERHAGRSYAVQAHLERAGPFRPGANNGYNVEHIRDWNNAAPRVAFGFESQPGHQASPDRGEYYTSRSSGRVASSGLYTYGGTGCYAAAEAGRPGYDVSGRQLTEADRQPGGILAKVPAAVPLEYITVCRPGVRTMWDALLSEGRKFWFFASSDWHSRGDFAFTERKSDNDFLPGEYQKTYTFVRNRNPDAPSQDVVDGLRSGNNFATMGDLITGLDFKVCLGAGEQKVCATMGETLTVEPGQTVEVVTRFRDPAGPNHSPYSFNNPALLQVGIEEPLDKPTVRYVDLITGTVGQPISPSSSEYRNPRAPATTKIAAKFTADGRHVWRTDGEWRVVGWRTVINEDRYFRLRGSNLPAGTPNERDGNGNPLRDDLADYIACSDPACPPHVNGKFDADVEAWGDLWFYANPVFVKVGTPNPNEAVRSASAAPTKTGS